MNKKYIVRLTLQERNELAAVIKKLIAQRGSRLRFSGKVVPPMIQTA
jgi:hypothetical protein